MFSSHQVKFEALSVRERMGKVLERVSAQSFTDFAKLFDPEEGRSGVVVTFLAIMELAKESLLEIIQSDSYGPIHVRAKTGQSHEESEYDEQDIEEKLADIETTSDQA
jgi:segregation and condensation protein A